MDSLPTQKIKAIQIRSSETQDCNFPSSRQILLEEKVPLDYNGLKRLIDHLTNLQAKVFSLRYDLTRRHQAMLKMSYLS